MTDTNVNTPVADDDEYYDDATAAFPSVEDLAPSNAPDFGEGRLVAIYAKSNGERKGNNGDMYGYTETITVALDDGPDGDQVTEMVGPAPYRVDMRHSTGFIHAKLKSRVEGKHPKSGRPLKYLPLIGRINTQPSTQNKKVPAYGLAPKTDDDLVTLERHKALLKSITAELEAADKAKDDADGFDD
ncbi:MAG: hypothetical protein ABW022_17730 [Actinoplanes sp.]